MRAFVSALLMFVAIALLPSAMAAPREARMERHLDVELATEADAPSSGSSTTLALVMKPAAGWHGYWKVPGDAGFPMQVKWALPQGVTVGELAYPVPKTLLIDGLMNHVLEGPYALLTTLTIPAGVEPGTQVPISVDLKYLVCSRSVCVPETTRVSTTLSVGDGSIDPRSRARFDAWRRALPRSVGTPARFHVSGGKMRIAFPLPKTATLAPVHLFPATADAVEYAARQSFARRGDTLLIETSAGPVTPNTLEGVLTLADGTGLSFTAAPGAVPLAEQPSRVGTLRVAFIALCGAILGGLILNVMPCVFPILSLKAFSLAQAAGEERQAQRDAVAYAAGVILVCAALGGLILGLRAAGAEIGWAFQLQHPAVILLLILLMSAIALNLAGLFELGSFSSGSRLTEQHGATGAFWTGALAAFVATPCTGPFMAGALGAAMLLPVGAALLVFAGLGFGLSLPFLALGFVPALRKVLPKPGPWMETFRRFLSLPMFATVLGLAWLLGRQTGVDGMVVGMGSAMLLATGLWYTGLRQRRFKALAWVPALVALLIAALCLPLLPKEKRPEAGPEVAQRFDATRLASLRAEGKAVFLYFTADWCLTCKVNERAAIERKETEAAFEKAGVITMVGDWTRGDRDISRFLAERGRSGIPLYLWYAPGSGAQVLPQVLTPELLKSLAARTEDEAVQSVRNAGMRASK